MLKFKWTDMSQSFVFGTGFTISSCKKLDANNHVER
jgi:hypothetical protein